MFVLIIRHAKAEPRAVLGSIGNKDAARSLTDAGRKDMRKAAKGLRTLVPEIDVLAASPLVRAQETAAIISERYDAMPVTELAPLAPGGSNRLCSIGCAINLNRQRSPWSGMSRISESLPAGCSVDTRNHSYR